MADYPLRRWSADSAALTRLIRDGRYHRLWAAVVVLLGAVWAGSHASRLLSLAPFLAVIGALVWLRPQLALPGLFLAVAFVPLEIGTGTASAINVAMVGVVAVTGLWFLRMATGRHLRLLPSEANLPWLALVLATGVSILAGWALWDPRAVVKSNFLMVQLAQWAIFALSACAFWLGGNWLPERRALRLLVLVVLLLGGILLAGLSLPALAGVRRRLLLQGPIFRIWFVALAGAWALFRFDLRLRWRWFLGLAAIAMVLLSMRTGSGWQSGWLPPLVALVALVAVRLGRGFTLRAMVAGGVLAVPLALYVLPEVAVADLWSLETRILAWRGLLTMMGDRWLFGLGLAAYWHYWRDVLGYFAYFDPTTGWLHYTYQPQVNMHSTYVDVFGQAGLVGVSALMWLIIALFREIRRKFAQQTQYLDRAYLAACASGLIGMLFAGLLADWIFPFAYNVGLRGFRDSFVGWLLLGGVVALRDTRPGEAA